MPNVLEIRFRRLSESRQCSLPLWLSEKTHNDNTHPKKKRKRKKRKREWKRPTTKNLFQSQTNWNEIWSHLEPKNKYSSFSSFGNFYITILRILSTILASLSLSLSLCLGCLTFIILAQEEEEEEEPTFSQVRFCSLK